MSRETEESTLDFDRLLAEEQDLFKLTILGHAAIEERIDAEMAEAFAGNTPTELKRLPLRNRLALFGGLTQMPKKYMNAIATLTKLRNEFAHGQLQELTPERAQALKDGFRPLVGSDHTSISVGKERAGGRAARSPVLAAALRRRSATARLA